MQSVAIFACLVAAVSAHGFGGNNWGMPTYNNGGMMNGGMMNGGMMNGGMMNGGMMNNNNNNNMMMQNMLSQILQGAMNNNNNNMNNMGGGRRDDDDDDEHAEMMKKMMQMMEKMMDMGKDGKKDDDDDEDMKAAKEMMALKQFYEMTQMADAMMVYMNYKKTENEFMESMSALCLVVNTTIQYTMSVNSTQTPAMSDAEFDKLTKDAENWTDKQKAEYVINLLRTNQDAYGEMFFRFATWACMTGEKYAKSSMMIEKMMRGEY